jgi:hypothetical protein
MSVQGLGLVEGTRASPCCNEEKSGEHDSDFWKFYSNLAFLKWRQGMPPVPAQAVYYCNIMCFQFPSIDGKFADKLAETLKSDSSEPMSGEAGASSVQGSERKDSRGEREMMKKMDAAMEQQGNCNERMYQQRQEFIDLQKQSCAESSERETWKEYTAMSERFMSLAGDRNNKMLLRNMATRLWHLEKRSWVFPKRRLSWQVIMLEGNAAHSIWNLGTIVG